MKFFKTNEEKDLQRKQLIVDAITDLGLQIKAVDQLCADNFEAAVKAAELKQDDYVDELLETIAYLQDFACDLRLLKLRVETAAKTAGAFDKLKGLPDVVSACNQLIVNVPNMSKLAKGMENLDQRLSKIRESLKKFTGGARVKKKDSLLVSLFGDNSEREEKRQKQLASLKDALTARLIGAQSAPADATATAATNATTPAANTASSTGASIDDIISGLDDARKG